MPSKIIKVKNAKGIHLQPATKLTQLSLANPELDLSIKYRGVIVKADSVIDILSLGLAPDVEVEMIIQKENTQVFKEIEAIFS